MAQHREMFVELPPPMASVIRKHYTSEHPKTGRPEDLACDLDCDRSTVYNLAKTTDMSARKVRRMLLASGRDHQGLARDTFAALGFEEAGYTLVRTADVNRWREGAAKAQAALQDLPAREAID